MGEFKHVWTVVLPHMTIYHSNESYLTFLNNKINNTKFTNLFTLQTLLWDLYELIEEVMENDFEFYKKHKTFLLYKVQKLEHMNNLLLRKLEKGIEEVNISPNNLCCTYMV